MESTRAGRPAKAPVSLPADVICLSHLRWKFVFQRPQHLLTRCARDRRVFFVEEPILDATAPHTVVEPVGDRLWVVVPHLPAGLTADETNATLADLLDNLIDRFDITSYLLWYYTPMALPFTRHLSPDAIVYDCMDELSGFKGAPPEMAMLERELFERADVVFTGGRSLYEHKRALHRNIHPFPSSVDVAHFRRARDMLGEPGDQRDLPYPRIGFFGVIDERLDVGLVEAAAQRRFDWQFVFVGPVVKIDPAILPRMANVHFLGQKSYEELPAYLSGWNVAMLPFARNDATRFISPTKTPEYLSAGKPVVSTSITDVVRPYASLGLVRVGDEPDEFVRAIERAFEDAADPRWWQRVDEFLATQSWDDTWARMHAEIERVLVGTRPRVPSSELVSPPSA